MDALGPRGRSSSVRDAAEARSQINSWLSNFFLSQLYWRTAKHARLPSGETTAPPTRAQSMRFAACSTAGAEGVPKLGRPWEGAGRDGSMSRPTRMAIPDDASERWARRDASPRRMDIHGGRKVETSKRHHLPTARPVGWPAPSPVHADAARGPAARPSHAATRQDAPRCTYRRIGTRVGFRPPCLRGPAI